MPSVSVVIPAFNSARFIAAAIQSVQDQTLQPLEIIVIDDGSTDGTPSVVQAARGSIAVFYHRIENSGAGYARNIGVSRARGEWIAFLDADDRWHANRLEVQLAQVASHPDKVFFHCDFEVALPDETLVARSAAAPFRWSPDDDWRKLSTMVFGGRPFPFPSTVLLRKSVFEQFGGFRSDMQGKYYEDFELFARMAERFPVFFEPRALVRYRLQRKSQRDMHCTPNVLILLSSLWELWRGQPEKQAILVKHYAYHYSMLAKYALQDGDYLRARKYYRTSFRYFPGLYLPWNWKNLRRWTLCYLPGLRAIGHGRRGKERLVVP